MQTPLYKQHRWVGGAVLMVVLFVYSDNDWLNLSPQPEQNTIIFSIINIITLCHLSQGGRRGGGDMILIFSYPFQ